MATVGTLVVVVVVTAATLVVLYIFTLQDVRGSFVNSCEMEVIRVIN